MGKLNLIFDCVFFEVASIETILRNPDFLHYHVLLSQIISKKSPLKTSFMNSGKSKDVQ